ncbi:hypothetical protein [Vibrio maerlii]|uniref:hypothetical protein n=1 Tax=Vibrio maerlii TaxID=2231648 RepID=UPI000E3CFEB2|nr:hypothetical protein [Vibrio maerlii]
MKYITIIFFSFVIVGCATMSPEETEVTVEKSIEKISILVNTIDEQLPQDMNLSVEKALITLHARQSVKASGKLDVVASGQLESGTANSMRLQFTIEPTATVNTEDDNDDINEVIKHVIKAVAVIQNDPTFKLQRLSVQLAMKITKGVDGGVNIEFLGFGFGTQVEELYESGNSIDIVFTSPPM